MEPEEAKQYAERVRLYFLQHNNATNEPPSVRDQALVCIATRLTEVEAQRDELKKQIESLVQTARGRAAHMTVIE